MNKLIEAFCDKNHTKYPQTKEELDQILNRMYNVGLLTEQEKKEILSKENEYTKNASNGKRR